MKRILTTLQEKWPEYLLEILVLIIGIYGAIMVDNWNEKQKEREKERFLLSEINREMKENKEKFEEIQKSFQVVVESAKKLISLRPLNEKILTDTSFTRIFRGFISNPSYDPSLGTIQSIINSGSLDLIQNQELRRLIVSWEYVLQDYKEEEIIAQNYGYQLMQWFTNNHMYRPEYATTDYSKVDFNLLQAKIGEKLDRYSYLIEEEGESSRVLDHINRMIELTEGN